jgi:hypothetical protein
MIFIVEMYLEQHRMDNYSLIHCTSRTREGMKQQHRMDNYSLLHCTSRTREGMKQQHRMDNYSLLHCTSRAREGMKHNNTGWIITHYFTVQVGQEKE